MAMVVCLKSSLAFADVGLGLPFILFLVITIVCLSQVVKRLWHETLLPPLICNVIRRSSFRKGLGATTTSLMLMSEKGFKKGLMSSLSLGRCRAICIRRFVCVSVLGSGNDFPVSHGREGVGCYRPLALLPAALIFS